MIVVRRAVALYSVSIFVAFITIFSASVLGQSKKSVVPSTDPPKSTGYEKVGRGLHRLSNTQNNRVGMTQVVGILQQGNENVLGQQAHLKLEKGAVVDLGGFNATIAGLSGDAGSKVTNSGFQKALLTVSVPIGANNLFYGRIEDGCHEKSILGLVKDGNGDLTLFGPNTYTHGTWVNEGRLIGTTSSLQRSFKVAEAGNIMFSQHDDGEFRGVICGPGNVIINSRGIIQFKHNQKYTGPTDIQSGHLVLNAVLLSSKEVYIRHDAILSGIGTVAGNVCNSGILRPGNLIGVFKILGNYIQKSDGILEITIADPSSHNWLEIRGTANLSGLLRLTFLSKDFELGTEFIILRASKIIGEFDKVEGHDRSTMVMLYHPTDVRIKILPEESTEIQSKPESTDSSKKEGAADVANKQPTEATTSAAESHPPEDEATNKPVAVAKQQEAQQRSEELHDIFEQLIPKMAMNIKDVLFNATNMQYAQINEQLAALREGGPGMFLNGLSQDPLTQQRNEHDIRLENQRGISFVERANPSLWHIFANGSGVFSTITTAADIPKQRAMTGYFNAGVSYLIHQNVSVGTFVGYQGIKLWDGERSWLKSNGIKYGFYGTGQWQGFYGNAMIGAGLNSLEMKRAIHFGQGSWRLRSYPKAWELNSLLAGGYELPIGQFRLGINSSLQYTYLGISSFRETGFLPIRVGSQNPSSLVSTLGASLAYHWKLSPSFKIIPQIGLSWQHEYLNYGQQVPLTLGNGAAASTFQLASVTAARNNAFGTAGVVAQLGPRFGGYCYYNPQFGGGDIVAHGFLLGLNYSF